MRELCAIFALILFAPFARAANGGSASQREVSGILRITAKSKALSVVVSAPRGKDLFLVELRPYQTYDPKSNLPSVWRGKLSSHTIDVSRFDGARDRLYAKFQLVEAKTREAMGNAHYVDDLSALGARDFDFPNPQSIKGLQVQDVDDAIALGVKYAAVNVMVSSVINWSNAAPQEMWEVDGEKIPINVAYVRQLDAQFKKLTDAGINVTAILLNGVPKQPDPKNPLIHPNTDLANAPFHLGAFNVTDERGLRYYRAAVEYLANRYSQPDAPHGWVSGYIIGNEVQAHWEWYNIGRMSLDDFVQHYGIALRVADLAARRFHAKIRTYVSMDHHWNSAHRADPLMAFRGNDFLIALNRWAKSEGDFPWHVAFHPYPENLFEPRFWNDKQAPLSFDAPKVTFKNIEVLTTFLERKYLLYGGKPRRIILSEQGFHTPNGEDGEKIQAAAYAYAYYKLSRTPGIDAFILHRHVDHKQEFGLRLGLWTWKEDDPAPSAPGKKKFIYEVFRLADTDQWKETFEFAKPLIGIKDWNDALPAKKIETTADLTPHLAIVTKGASDYHIVVPDKASPVEEFAARELQHFLKEMSGVTLPIVREKQAGKKPGFLIGWSKRTKSLVAETELRNLREDGVFIKTAGRDVALLGSNARGQLYSVYVLLERFLGVRFLARDCPVVPKRETVTLPAIDYSHAPPFMYRETLYFDSFPKEIAARQRLNGPASQCDETVGGKIAIHPYVHSFSQLVPPDKYFKERPEYFSLVGGKRTNATIHGQLCLTNPDVLKIATEQVLRWIREHPDVPIFDVSQNDGDGACECEKCAAVVKEEGSQHGPILRFVNAIADVVAKEHPGKWIETLAYAYSTKPPALTKPRDNVIIRLCHAGCYFHGFERCGLGANLTAYLQEWSKLTRRVFIWHYTTNFAHYLAPNQNLDGLARDVQYYAAHGVNGLMVQGNYQSPGGELAELRQYLAAQLMWDPNRDPEMIRVEFCNGYYGAAANDVLSYLALADEAAKDANVHAFGSWDPKDTVSPQFVAEAIKILTRARTRANSEEVANRITRLFLPLWYMQLSDPDRYGLNPADAAQMLMEFRTAVEKNHVTHICEGGENVAAWLAAMEARYGAVPCNLVYDLYLNLSQARRENCLDWRPETMQKDGRALLTIFHHPPEKGVGDATFEVLLPVLKENARLILRFGTAFTGPTANGVRFSILVNGKEAWTTTQKELAPIEREVELSAWAGKAIQLTLRVDGLGNIQHDWANWVRPQILVEKKDGN